MRKCVLTLLCCVFAFKRTHSEPLDIKVRIFSTDNFSECLFRVKNGFYHLVALDQNQEIIDTIYSVDSMSPYKLFTIQKNGPFINVKIGKKSLGNFYVLAFLSEDTSANFLIHVNKKERWYDGSLILWSQNQNLIAVNHVNLEQYVAGVVESEGGNFLELEYFKAQAVLARTFAIRNLNKHIKEGYNLKDDISSQVYHSRAYYRNADLIRLAVTETKDTIVVDAESGKPIFAAFHANSGGFTVCAEDAWHRKLENLKAKPDPYSVGMGSYEWTKRLPKKDVQEYIARKFQIKITPELVSAVDSFRQPTRLNHFYFNGKSFPLRDFRFHFHLRSTFFDIESDGDFYILKGKGNGHGVGMSQEGAINMASQGYNYQKIIYFYYENVKFESLSSFRHFYAEAAQLAF